MPLDGKITANDIREYISRATDDLHFLPGGKFDPEKVEADPRIPTALAFLEQANEFLEKAYVSLCDR